MRRVRDLGQHLVRKSVGALSEDRGGACGHCGRTPLTGEHVHRYEDGQLLCELCRPLRRIEDAREELVRHPEHGHAVRLVGERRPWGPGSHAGVRPRGRNPRAAT
jgi:hypothetical protein